MLSSCVLFIKFLHDSACGDIRSVDSLLERSHRSGLAATLHLKRSTAVLFSGEPGGDEPSNASGCLPLRRVGFTPTGHIAEGLVDVYCRIESRPSGDVFLGDGIVRAIIQGEMDEDGRVGCLWGGLRWGV